MAPVDTENDLSNEAFFEWFNSKNQVTTLSAWKEAKRRAMANPWLLFDESTFKTLAKELLSDLSDEALEAELARRKNE